MKKEFENEYENIKIAEFEFSCLEPVSQYVTLYSKGFENNLEIIKLYVDT